jgi:hypothetical protein
VIIFTSQAGVHGGTAPTVILKFFYVGDDLCVVPFEDLTFFETVESNKKSLTLIITDKTLFIWALRDSNPRPPRCKREALPTELNALSCFSTVVSV